MEREQLIHQIENDLEVLPNQETEPELSHQLINPRFTTIMSFGPGYFLYSQSKQQLSSPSSNLRLNFQKNIHPPSRE
jgi:hypothetical protein